MAYVNEGFEDYKSSSSWPKQLMQRLLSFEQKFQDGQSLSEIKANRFSTNSYDGSETEANFFDLLNTLYRGNSKDAALIFLDYLFICIPSYHAKLRKFVVQIVANKSAAATDQVKEKILIMQLWVDFNNGENTLENLDEDISRHLAQLIAEWTLDRIGSVDSLLALRQEHILTLLNELPDYMLSMVMNYLADKLVFADRFPTTYRNFFQILYSIVKKKEQPFITQDRITELIKRGISLGPKTGNIHFWFNALSLIVTREQYLEILRQLFSDFIFFTQDLKMKYLIYLLSFQTVNEPDDALFEAAVRLPEVEHAIKKSADLETLDSLYNNVTDNGRSFTLNHEERLKRFGQISGVLEN